MTLMLNRVEKAVVNKYSYGAMSCDQSLRVMWMWREREMVMEEVEMVRVMMVETEMEMEME
jgi:hypothetical protein